jgi:predicted DNA-binding antitoxin AbrB/MazE fold protein
MMERCMVKTLSAVYENGMLRPLEPLSLKEQQHVTVTISDVPIERADAWIDYQYLASIDTTQEAEPTLEEVCRILSKIPGNVFDDIRVERDSRG